MVKGAAADAKMRDSRSDGRSVINCCGTWLDTDAEAWLYMCATMDAMCPVFHCSMRSKTMSKFSLVQLATEF
jgi:hypothetical protein